VSTLAIIGADALAAEGREAAGVCALALAPVAMTDAIAAAIASDAKCVLEKVCLCMFVMRKKSSFQ
jgi:hypothetical protein